MIHELELYENPSHYATWVLKLKRYEGALFAIRGLIYHRKTLEALFQDSTLCLLVEVLHETMSASLTIRNDFFQVSPPDSVLDAGCTVKCNLLIGNRILNVDILHNGLKPVMTSNM